MLFEGAKKLLAAAAALFAALMMICAPVMADVPSVVDTYDLFTDSEESELSGRCAAFTERTGIEAAILAVDADTVGGYEDEDTIRYVEAYGDSSLGENYIALIINMDIRYYYIDIKGSDAFSVYSDRRQEELGDVVVQDLISDDYAAAGMDFLDRAEEQYAHVHATGSYSTVQQERKGFRKELIPGSAGIAAIISAIATRARKGKHSEKKLATDADGYVVPGTVNLHINRDVFVSQYVTRVPRTQTPRGGGGGFTTTHTSAGGHMHSGHGGHF